MEVQAESSYFAEHKGKSLAYMAIVWLGDQAHPMALGALGWPL